MISLKTPSKPEECDSGLPAIAPKLIEDPHRIVVFVGVAVVGSVKRKYYKGQETMAGYLDEADVELAPVAIEPLIGEAAREARRLLDAAREERTRQARLALAAAQEAREAATDEAEELVNKPIRSAVLDGWD